MNDKLVERVAYALFAKEYADATGGGVPSANYEECLGYVGMAKAAIEAVGLLDLAKALARTLEAAKAYYAEINPEWDGTYFEDSDFGVADAALAKALGDE